MAEIRFRGKWVGPAYLALGLMALASSGCLVVAAGVAGGAAVGYFYYQGEVCHNYNAAPANTFEATRGALTDLGLPILRQEFQDGTGSIETLTRAQDKVHISFTAHGDQGAVTQVGVRVGIFGNEETSARVLGQIEARLMSSGQSRLVPQPSPALSPIQPVSAVDIPPPTPPPPLAPEQTPPAVAEPETKAPPLAGEPYQVYK